MVDQTWSTIDSSAGPVAIAAPARNGLPAGAGQDAYRDGWLEELKLDLFMVPGLGGAKLYPHRGQSLWLSPYGVSLEDDMAMAEFLASEPTDPAEVLERRYQAVLTMLSRIVVSGNITDARGQPYPMPTGPGDVAPFKAWPSRLVSHLLTLIRGEPEGNANGASGALPAG